MSAPAPGQGVATPLVISIQSQVVYGHVGNSAAVLPLQAHGINVAAVPTTLLSNNPHYPTLRGRILEPELLADLLLGVEERGLVEAAAVIQTGYLGSAENGRLVAEFVRRALARNPAITYLCDPVMGDADLGVFVAPGVDEIIRTELVPQARMITPNQFELGLLLGRPITTIEEIVEVGSARAPTTRALTVVTGCSLADTPEGKLDTVAVAPGTHATPAAWRVTTPRIPIRPAGTGDLFSALVVANLLDEAPYPDVVARAVSSTYAVLAGTATIGAGEMCLEACVSSLTRPERVFDAVQVAPGRTA